MKTVPVAKALIFDADDNVLVMRRSQSHPHLGGHIDLPGGTVEPNEEPGAAVAREVAEETGLTIPVERFTLLFSGTQVTDDLTRIRFFYVARLDQVKPEITLSFEHEQADWLPLSQLETVENEFRQFYHDAIQHVRQHQLFPQ